MKPAPQTYQKWKYLFLAIGISALACCAAGIYYKQYLIATATGLVAVVQLLNYWKWKRQRP